MSRPFADLWPQSTRAVAGQPERDRPELTRLAGTVVAHGSLTEQPLADIGRHVDFHCRVALGWSLSRVAVGAALAGRAPACRTFTFKVVAGLALAGLALAGLALAGLALAGLALAGRRLLCGCLLDGGPAATRVPACSCGGPAAVIIRARALIGRFFRIACAACSALSAVVVGCTFSSPNPS